MIVAIMTTALAGTAWAETYEIVFKSAESDSSTDLGATPAVSDVLSAGAGYVASFSDCSKIYVGVSGVKLGASKANGTINFTLNTNYQSNIKSIKVVSAQYGSDTGKLSLFSGSTSLKTGITPGTDYTHTFNSPTTVSSIKLSTSSKRAYITKIILTTEEGGTPTPSLSVNPTSIAFGEKTINDSYEETFDVSFANLTEDLTVSGFSGVTVSPTTISKDASSPQTVTVTYAPTAEGSISGNITVSNTADAVSETVAVTGSAYDPSNITYYEKVTSAPSDWEGDYIFTGINSSNYYALTGVTSNLGTAVQVDVTEDGIASTSTTDAYKVTVAETTNGYSLYMDGVGYLSYSGSSNQLHASDEFEESTCEWTISFASGVATITNIGVAGRMLQFNYNSGNPRFACYTSSQVKLTLFKLNDGTPSISADDVDITYDAEEGEIEYTIGNPVNGGSLVASTTADWLTVDDAAKTASTGTIEFVCDSNPTGTQRTAEVTLTYTYNTNEPLTKTVVITQAGNPDALVTIAEARVQTGTVKTKGIVTSCVGTTAFIQDATAAICVYGSELTVGDEVRVIGTITTYKGLIEITDPDVTVLSQNNTVTPEVMTIAQVIASTKQGWFVKIEDATVKVIDSSNSHNNTIAQGENTITLHGNLGTVEENDIITFNGNIGCFNTVQIVNPTDIEVTGSVTPTTYTLSWTAGANTELFVFDAADETTPLTTGVAVTAGTTINVSVDVTSGCELDELIVKDASDNDVALTEITAGSYYSFEMPASNVTITSSAVASSVTPTAVATVTFDFSTNVFGFPEGSSNKTVTATDYTNGTYTINVEGSEGNGYYWNSNGYLLLGKNGATLTFPAFPFNVSKISITGTSSASDQVQQNIYVGDDAVSTATTGAKNVTNEYEIAANKQTAGTIYTLKVTSAHNTQISKIEVFGYESVTVGNLSYATFASDNALDFTGSNIKAFYATESAAGTLSFTQVNKVPADTGVLLYADGGATVDVPVFTGAADAVTNNVFVRGTGAAINYTENDQNYILFNGADGIGFYRANNNTVATNRAYIHVNGNGVKGFVINLEDDATGISLMEDGRSQMEDGVIYNVAGQRISKMQKGINIVNGKKILK